ncbi:unnamed protein product, partial [Ectocarpus sp. 12 AP-2014]
PQSKPNCPNTLPRNKSSTKNTREATPLVAQSSPAPSCFTNPDDTTSGWTHALGPPHHLLGVLPGNRGHMSQESSLLKTWCRWNAVVVVVVINRTQVFRLPDGPAARTNDQERDHQE